MFSGIRPQLVVAVVLSGSLFVGCGSGSGGGSGGSSSPPGLASIEVKPNSTTLAVGDSGKQFSAEPKDAAGNTINGEEIFWEIANNDGQKGVVNATGWYRPPTILPDSSNVVMVKAFSRNNPGINDFASVSLLTGGRLSFGGNARVAPHTTGDDGNAFASKNIAVLDRAVFTVWSDNPNWPSGNYDIFFAKSPDRGSTFSCQTSLQRLGDQLSPNIRLDGQGNVYIVAYDNSIGSNFGVFFAKGQPNSNNCVDFVQQNVVFFSSTETYFSPNLAIGPDGNVYISWSWSSGAASGIYFAKGILDSQTGQVSFGEKVVVTEDTTGNAVYEDVEISVSAAGDVYIAFSQILPGDSHIFLARSVDGGASFQGSTRVDDQAYSLYPAMAIDSAGVIYVAWTGFGSDGMPKIYMKKSTDGAQTFSNSLNQISNLAGEQWLPALSVDQSGSVYLAWGNIDSTDNYDIYFAKSMDGSLNFSDPVRVNDDTGTAAQYSPSLSLDSAGRAFILWFDERNTCFPSCPYALYLAMGQ